MKRVLLTGMSGTGKSTLIVEFAARGYQAVDLDSTEWSEWVEFIPTPGLAESAVEPDRDWVWREERVRSLLSESDAGFLFVSGCAANMGQFLSLFDHVVLLRAPVEVITERLAVRTNNPYGKRPDERARVLELIRTIEPLLRNAADHEVDTSAPLHEVVAAVLQIAGAEERVERRSPHSNRVP
jgi:shikimate kinase